MSKSKNKRGILECILAIFVVFLMSAGAFIGAAENDSANDASQASVYELQENSVADFTAEAELELPLEEILDVPEYGIPVPVIPENPAEGYYYEPPENEITYTLDSGVTITYIQEADSVNDVPTQTNTERNRFREALSYITKKVDTTESASVASASEPNPSSRATSTLNLVFGADSDNYDGQGLGRIYKTGSNYRSYAYYMMYTYGRPPTSTASRNRGWAVYDLEDLKQFEDAKIVSGAIWYRNYRRYYATQLDFWTMKSIPYDTGAYTSTAKTWYDEIGGTGSASLGSITWTTMRDTTYHDEFATIPAGGLTELNSRLTAGNYDFSMGSDVSKCYGTYQYGYLYPCDVRLMLNITYTTPPPLTGEVAVGDAVDGYTRSSGTPTPMGRMYTTTTYRSYATWDISTIKKSLPTDPDSIATVPVGVSLRLNNLMYSASVNTISVYHMKTNPDGATAATIYADAADGTQYYKSKDTTTYPGPAEFDWDLGKYAVQDLEAALNGSQNFFAVGLSRTSGYTNYLGCPKLVIQWKIIYPPLKTIQFGSDNPKYSGDAMGYSQKTFAGTYVCNSRYNAKSELISEKGLTQEDRGWAVFDIKNLTKIPGVTPKKAKLLLHNFEISYAKEINFTLLKTTPSHASASAKIIWTESGPTGTQIGTYDNPIFVDSAHKTLVVTLNPAAVTALKTKLASKDYTFAIGMYIKSSHKIPCSADFRDIRLLVDCDYTGDLQPSTGDGIAFGDDWSGYLEKYTDARNKDVGYMYSHHATSLKMENRSYVQWEVAKIADLFPAANLSFVKITKLSLIFNHYLGTANNIYIYDIVDSYARDNSITTTTPSILNGLFTDCGNGSLYYGPSSAPTASTVEYEWALSSAAVSDFQKKLESGTKYFNIGIIAKSKTGDTLGYGPKLAFKWEYDFMSAMLTDPRPEGYEASVLEFNASASMNDTGGFGGLTYEWDWEADGVFDESSASPLANYTWDDDHKGYITLRINDSVTGRNKSASFWVVVHNVDPRANTTIGKISPQPAWEGDKVTFSGFEVVDPGNDTWTYLWDFDGDGVYDVSGNFKTKTIPSETWYYGDDFIGKAALAVVDDDGGTTNLSILHEAKGEPVDSWTGYVYETGVIGFDPIYVDYVNGLESRRGWAKLDLTEVPEDGIITKIVFTAEVVYNQSVNSVGVKLLTKDPTTLDGKTLYKEIGLGTRLFGIPWTIDEKAIDLTNLMNTPSGAAILQAARAQGWLGLGFVLESPIISGIVRGYMLGYSDNLPALEIEYITYEPRYLFPIFVKNTPPKIDCTKLTVKPTELSEGEDITVENLEFYDTGNDLYEYNITIGDSYSTGWIPLGERAQSAKPAKILLATQWNKPSANEKVFYDWFVKQAKKEGWAYEYRCWLDPLLDFDDYSLAILCCAENAQYYYKYSATIKSEIIDKGISLYIYGRNGYRLLEQLSLGQYAYRSIGGQNYMTIHDNYAGITDGYFGRVTLSTGGGSPNAVPIQRYLNLKGVSLAHPSSYTDNSVFAVWDKNVHRYNSYTGDRNSGTVGGKIAYFGIRMTAPAPTFSFDWDIIMNRTFKWLLVGAPGGEPAKPAWGVYGPGNHKVKIPLDATAFDDYPKEATTADDLLVTIYVRDDDHHVFVPNHQGVGYLAQPVIVDAQGTNTNSLRFTNGRKVVVDDEYNIYVIYTKQDDPLITQHQVYVAKSETNGNTWEYHKVSTPAYLNYYQYGPSIAIDSEGVLHAVWTGGSTTSTVQNVRYANSVDGGVTWGEHFNITRRTTTGAYYLNPSIAVDDDDTVHVSYYGRRTSLAPNQNYNIYYRNRSYDGIWSSNFRVTNVINYNPQMGQNNPSIALDSEGNVHIVWSGKLSTALSKAYNLGYRIHWSGNDTWSNIIMLTNDPVNGSTNPCITIDDNDNIHVVWDAGGGGRMSDISDVEGNIPGSGGIMYMKYIASTGQWTPIEYLINATNQGGPTVAFNEKGELDVVWRGNRLPAGTTPTAVQHAEKTGTTWKLNYNIFRTRVAQWHTNLLCSPPNSIAEEGFAFVWSDGIVRYWTSRDFRMGKPEWTYGLDWCNISTVKVKNVAPKINVSGMIEAANEQDILKLNIIFEDPALLAPTEVFEYKIDWGDGSTSDWIAAPDNDIEDMLKGRNPEEWFADGPTLTGEYSFNDQLITYLLVSFYQIPFVNYDILIEGFNTSTSAWETIYSYDNMNLPTDFEKSFTKPVYSRWRVEVSDYPETHAIFYEYEYKVEGLDSPYLGYITAIHKYSDDMPTNTPWDINDLVIEIREDDTGYDKKLYKLNVSSVAPTITPGKITPDLSEVLDEGTLVSVVTNRFDDIAFDEPTETFEYEYDWGDGTTSGRKSDFEIRGEGGELSTIAQVGSAQATAYTNGRNLVMDSKGNLYAAFLNFIGVSADQGKTWTLYEIPIPGVPETGEDPATGATKIGQTPYYPCIAIDSKDILHAVWSPRLPVKVPYNPGQSVLYGNSSDGGKTWGNFSVLMSGYMLQRTYIPGNDLYMYEQAYDPTLAVDGNGVVHVTWRFYKYFRNYTTGFPPPNPRYYYVSAISYVNNSGGWGTPFDVYSHNTTSGVRQQMRPSIAADSENNVHIVTYGRTPASNTETIYYYKLDAKTGWAPRAGLTTTNYNREPCITTDADNNLHLTWHQYISSGYAVYYRKWDATTKTWGSTQTVVPGAYRVNNMHPSIGIDQRGYVYITYQYQYYIGSDVTNSIVFHVNDGTGFTPRQEVTTHGKFKGRGNYQYNPSIMGHGPNCYPITGAALVWTARLMNMFDPTSQKYEVIFYSTDDFFNGFGPLKGIPPITHLYRDDNPSGTEEDMYELTLRVYDDDNAVGEYMVPLSVRNIWPEVDTTDLALMLGAEENALYTPEIMFSDPGTGPTETWDYWLDIDNSEDLTPLDITGKVTDTTVINNVSYGKIPIIRTPFNDDYKGKFGVYVYDDDAPAIHKYINLTYKLLGSGEITNVSWPANSGSMNYPNGRKLALASDGTLYTVYPSSSSPYEIKLGVSTDMGKTEPWTEKAVTKINTGKPPYYSQYYPSLAIDSKDAIHVVWSGSDSKNPYYTIFYTKSTDGGDTWSTPVTLSASGYRKSSTDYGYNYDPAIAVDSNDVVHVVWRYYEYYYSRPTRIYRSAVKYVNNNGGWGTPFDVDKYYSTSSSPASGYRPSIATDKSNNVHVVWCNYSLVGKSSTYNLHYRKMDAKTGWQTKVALTKETGGTYYASYNPCITSDLSGNLHVIWEQYNYVRWQYARNIRYIMWDAGTSTWGSIEDLTNERSDSQYYPTIGVDKAGTIYAAWYAYGEPVGTRNYYDIFMSVKKPGDKFSAPAPVTSDDYFSESQYYPNMLGYGPNAYPETGMAMVWRGYASGYRIFFYATDDYYVGQFFEPLGFKHKFNLQVTNTPPNVIAPTSIGFLPGEEAKLMIQLTDQGSDDIYALIDWGDGTTPDSAVFYNNGATAEPPCPPTYSATYGTAPITIDPQFYHTYDSGGDFVANLTLWDDDMKGQGMPGVSYLLNLSVMQPKGVKELTIELLESILPGRTGIVGYDTLELKYHGPEDMTVLVYNHIARPPFYWKTRLIMSVCNVQPGDTIFINGTYLTNESMFGTKLILKIYNESCGVIDVSEIGTVYTCLEPLQIGQRYGKYEVLNFTTLEGISYHHYSKFALKTEDALDHILRSINRDPRRGYGWWHQYWAWWNGYTIYRGLWVDDSRLDPQFGLVVFCEERAAVLDLMEVVKNCLDPVGVINITFTQQSNLKLDVEVWILSDFWWGGWTYFDSYYNLMPGESFTVDGSGLSGGVLTDRIMMLVYNADTGAYMDTINIRSSGEWFLEVEPGNIYGDFRILSSTLLLEDNTEWDDWWGGDANWWDYFFGFRYWENEKFRSSCGWEPEECFDKNASLEEEARICSNITTLKFVINMLAKADDLIARRAIEDAEAMTVQNALFEDEYMYHLKWAKRYWARGYDSMHKGRPHRAISDFKKAWKYSVIAIKWALQNPGDRDPSSGMDDPCAESGCNKECLKEYEDQIPTPWWMYWYYSWSNCKSICGYLTEHCGCYKHCACWDFGMQDGC